MDKKLFFQAIAKFTLGILAVGVLLFLPAGTLDYWNAWLFMVILFVPMFIAGIVMMVKNPELLRKRLQTKETESEQKTVIALSGLMFVGGFAVCGLHYRFGWPRLPDWAAVGAAVVFLAAYAMYGEVLRENTYLSRIVEVREGQTVVDTGLYGIVRHPMYAATVLLFLAMPLVLGSWLGFCVFLFYPVLIVKRIRNEEQVLERELAGYTAYKEKVKYRLVPFIW